MAKNRVFWQYLPNASLDFDEIWPKVALYGILCFGIGWISGKINSGMHYVLYLILSLSYTCQYVYLPQIENGVIVFLLFFCLFRSKY